MPKIKLGLFLLCFTLISEAFAADFKVRAREQYEAHNIRVDNQTYEFSGLSNTLNFWWEKPYELSYGFSVSPVLANIKSDDDTSFDDSISLWAVGFEAKYFPKLGPELLYVRPGLGWAQLKGEDNLDEKSGHFLYLGLGYEFKFSSFGLALEMGFRYVELEDGITDRITTPSIGFHFYEMF